MLLVIQRVQKIADTGNRGEMNNENKYNKKALQPKKTCAWENKLEETTVYGTFLVNQPILLGSIFAHVDLHFLVCDINGINTAEDQLQEQKEYFNTRVKEGDVQEKGLEVIKLEPIIFKSKDGRKIHILGTRGINSFDQSLPHQKENLSILVRDVIAKQKTNLANMSFSGLGRDYKNTSGAKAFGKCTQWGTLVSG
ncbi:hypothetical protein ACJX0J_035046, partial [Zea mays]